MCVYVDVCMYVRLCAYLYIYVYIENRDPSIIELLINSLLLLVAVTIGYWAMLLTMVYNVQLFICVIFGLAVGYFISNLLFVRINKNMNKSNNNSNNNDSDDVEGSNNSGSNSGMNNKKNERNNTNNNNNNVDNNSNVKQADTPCCPY